MGVLDFEAYELEYFVEKEGTYDDNGDFTREGYYDDNGDWIAKKPATESEDGEWVYFGKVNAVPAGVNNIIQLPDGRQVNFSFTIHIHDPLAREFRYGERLRLKTVFGKEQRKLTVKGFARYQYQCKIYA